MKAKINEFLLASLVCFLVFGMVGGWLLVALR